MATLVCSQCGKTKGFFGQFWQCTSEKCFLVFCPKCAGTTGLKSIFAAAASGQGGNIDKGFVHPTAACPKCNSPIKCI